ncbi:TadE/TadG family type IV pilus assembly protein [Planobispora rosea]|uniref:TadE/TadG family type IV pilus assembly protein n=1 Tax=Planobispora rosea TaxID=35762 RepID=UPI00083A9C47|nr:TadE/TadG family type IV pilus assembly protein [Planobispora rosea]
MTPPGARDRGGAAVELVLLAPFLILLALLAVAMGRLVAARLEVNNAAHQAARAASIARDPASATSAARSTADSALAGKRVTCAGRSVDVGLGSFEPGGNVTVTVTCRVRLADLAMVRIPGGTALSSTFVVPIDYWRSR